MRMRISTHAQAHAHAHHAHHAHHGSPPPSAQVCVAQLVNLLVLLAAVGATYRRAWARARGALLLLLLGCAHMTVALQLAATLRDGAPLDARAQVSL